MKNRKIFTCLIVFYLLMLSCSADKQLDTHKQPEEKQNSWWSLMPPVRIDGDAFYGSPCSAIKVSVDEHGVETAEVIFNVPSKLLSACAKANPNVNYLDYDGEYIILNVDRQAFGAGSWTGERYRSADFAIENETEEALWQEYIGVTWLNSEEYEAWRNLGSTSSKADSIKKVMK